LPPQAALPHWPCQSDREAVGKFFPKCTFWLFIHAPAPQGDGGWNRERRRHRQGSAWRFLEQ